MERTFNAMQILRVCALGRTRRRLHCSINGQNAEVLPDIGSDVDIMFLDYMLNHGLMYEATNEQVILADGRRKLVYGICVVQLPVSRGGKMIEIEPRIKSNTHQHDDSAM